MAIHHQTTRRSGLSWLSVHDQIRRGDTCAVRQAAVTARIKDTPRTWMIRTDQAIRSTRRPRVGSENMPAASRFPQREEFTGQEREHANNITQDVEGRDNQAQSSRS